MNMQRIAVIGAGTMGNGIAQICAVAGLQVTLVDVSEEALARGLETLATNLNRQVRKGTLTQESKGQALSRIHATTDYAALSDASLVIEAATENLDLKLRILKQIDQHVDAASIIDINTSSRPANLRRDPCPYIGLRRSDRQNLGYGKKQPRFCSQSHSGAHDQ
jgi:3-hydroxybutyryl-CoA dehydrogenase